jgi:uncharacterized membrane protein YfcA
VSIDSPVYDLMASPGMSYKRRTVGVYLSLGLVSWEVLCYVFFCLPGLLVGIYLGNWIFFSLSEKTFSRVIGVLLALVALQLMR